MDSEVKKQTLRLLTYGLYVLTAAHESEIAAGAVNWLSQASFNPPLVMVGVKADSRLHALIERSGAFAVNVPAASQKNIALAFFRPSQVEGNLINGYAKGVMMSAAPLTIHYLIGPASAPPGSTGEAPVGHEACISNISPRERRKRLVGGAIQFVVTLAILAALIATGADHLWRLPLFLLFWGAASGFFQWRDKT